MPTGIYKRTENMKTGFHMKGRTAWNKGISPSFKQIEKMSGKNNSGWKGGISLGENRKTYTDNYNKDYKRKMRIATVEALGGKCVHCGFNDIRALQIDHIKGGGNKERKEKPMLGQGKIFHKRVLESFMKGEIKYQLLCANCNWIKRVENKEIGNRFA